MTNNPAPKIEADKELDELMKIYYGDKDGNPPLKTALLAWRDKAVVAELERLIEMPNVDKFNIQMRIAELEQSLSNGAKDEQSS